MVLKTEASTISIYIDYGCTKDFSDVIDVE